MTTRWLAGLLLACCLASGMAAAPAAPASAADWQRWERLIDNQPAQALLTLQALDAAAWPEAERLRLRMLEVQALLELGRGDESMERLGMLREAVDRLRLPALQAAWSAYQGSTLQLQDKVSEAEPHYDRGLLLAQQVGDLTLQAYVHTKRVENLLRRRDIPAAAAALEAGRRVAEKSPDAQLQARHLYWAANLELELENLESAASLLHQAAARFKTLANLTWESDCARLLGNILVDLGRAAEAVTAARRSTALLETLDDPMYLAMARSTLAVALAASGRADEALPLSSRAIAAPELRQAPTAYLDSLLRHARVALLAGRRDAALQVLLRDVRPLLPPAVTQPSVHRRYQLLRAQTLSALGRAADAEVAWREVIDLDRSNFDRVLGAQLAAQRGVMQAQQLQNENDLLQSRTQTAERALQAETRLRWLISALVLVLGGGAAAALWWLRRVNRRIAAVAAMDALTGLLNRGSAAEAGRSALTAAQRLGEPLSVLMLDVDHFKQVNDRFGHAAGDEVLRQVAVVLRHGLRRSDHLARWGGEEFLLVLPATGLAEAAALGERQRAAMATATVQASADGAPLQVTLSVGVAMLQPGDSTLDAVIARADAALYRAKRQGRNRVASEADVVPA
jgi:diguanylate cyclase (GGDEF)-like protein